MDQVLEALQLLSFATNHDVEVSEIQGASCERIRFHNATTSGRLAISVDTVTIYGTYSVADDAENFVPSVQTHHDQLATSWRT